MPIGALVGASLIGAGVQGLASMGAARTQANAAERAADAQVEAAEVGADALRYQTDRGIEAQKDFAKRGLAEQRRGRAKATRGINRGTDRARDFTYEATNDARGRLQETSRRVNDIWQDETGRIIDENDRAFWNQQSELRPYASAGRNALDGLMFELGMGSRPDGYAGFQETPGYQFAFSEGQRAIDGSAASRGGLFSGQTMRDQMTFGTGLADQTYQTFMNRLTERANQGQAAGTQIAGFAGQRAAANNNARMNRGNVLAGNQATLGNNLANLSLSQGSTLANQAMGRGTAIGNINTGFGANAANTFNNLGQTQAQAFTSLGSNLASNAFNSGQARAQGFQDMGNARAAGMIGVGNAINDGIGNITGAMQMNSYLSAMNPNYQAPTFANAFGLG